uniref:Uncharacterized protein n=1 Tax=Rhipicephalus microplus TaxID=6941 RepID=A0A6M2CP40_RHIMP
MFKRKLTALGFNNTDNFNIQSQGEFRSLVAWLEDQKIRHYKLEDRAALRALDAPGWMQAFETYLQDLGCPHKSSDTKTVLDWLLGLAVHLEYSDDPDKYVKASKEADRDTGAPKMVHANPLDDLDCECVDNRSDGFPCVHGTVVHAVSVEQAGLLPRSTPCDIFVACVASKSQPLRVQAVEVRSYCSSQCLTVSDCCILM